MSRELEDLKFRWMLFLLYTVQYKDIWFRSHDIYYVRFNLLPSSVCIYNKKKHVVSTHGMPSKLKYSNVVAYYTAYSVGRVYIYGTHGWYYCVLYIIILYDDYNTLLVCLTRILRPHKIIFVYHTTIFK